MDYWVAPPADERDPVAGDARTGANAARAVADHGIAHTVFQSSIGAEKRHGAGEIDGLARTDDMREAPGGAGMTDAAVEAIIGMTAGLLEDFLPEQQRTPQTTTLTTLASWEREHLTGPEA